MHWVCNINSLNFIMFNHEKKKKSRRTKQTGCVMSQPYCVIYIYARCVEMGHFICEEMCMYISNHWILLFLHIILSMLATSLENRCFIAFYILQISISFLDAHSSLYFSLGPQEIYYAILLLEVTCVYQFFFFI